MSTPNRPFVTSRLSQSPRFITLPFVTYRTVRSYLFSCILSGLLVQYLCVSHHSFSLIWCDGPEVRLNRRHSKASALSLNIFFISHHSLALVLVAH